MINMNDTMIHRYTARSFSPASSTSKPGFITEVKTGHHQYTHTYEMLGDSLELQIFLHKIKKIQQRLAMHAPRLVHLNKSSSMTFFFPFVIRSSS